MTFTELSEPSEHSVWEHLVEGGNLNEFLKTIPEESHIRAHRVWADFNGRSVDILFKTDLIYDHILTSLGSAEVDREAFAERADQYPDISPYLFMLLDDKDPLPEIRKSLEPHPNLGECCA